MVSFFFFTYSLVYILPDIIIILNSKPRNFVLEDTSELFFGFSKIDTNNFFFKKQI